MTFNPSRGCAPNASPTHPGLHPGLLKFDRSAVSDERLDSYTIPYLLYQLICLQYKGIEHRPHTNGEIVFNLLFEPKETAHTGNVVNEMTVKELGWI